MNTIFAPDFQIWSLWLIAAGLLLIIEVLSQALLTFCLAVGCLFAFFAYWLGLSIEWQIVTLAVASAITYVTLLPYVKRWHERSARLRNRNDRTGMEALLGRHATVTHEIRPGHKGRVRIDGDNWQAIAPGEDHTIKAGSTVTVMEYDSIILTVRSLDNK